MTMTRSFLLGLTLAAASFAQVKLTRGTDVVKIEIGGKPFAEYHYGTEVAKPYIAPIHAASGTMVTRQFPMVKDLGETVDHLHHRGLWFGYIDVNGLNFWENEFSYKNPKAGTILAKLDEAKSGKTGTLRATSQWIDPVSKKPLLVDVTTYQFSGDSTLRKIDVDIVLTAKEKAVFGDDKDGVFGIRLADPLTEKASGSMVSSTGAKKMKEVWGKNADWIDYSGEIKGEKVGVAMFDHSTSFRHPSRWHSRDYGLFAVNPFGSQTFDKANMKSEVVLNPGEKLHFRYMVVIHPELSAEKIAELYKDWK